MSQRTPAAFIRFCTTRGIKLTLRPDGNTYRVRIHAGHKPDDVIVDYITAYLRQHKPQVVALLQQSESAEDTLAAALAEAAAGRLPHERVSLSPGTSTDVPNAWLPCAVERLRHFEQQSIARRAQGDAEGCARQTEHATCQRDSIDTFLAWYESACQPAPPAAY